ncbi:MULTISPECIES: Asp23/Gls24 family envelope stress response protein [unclassified Frondihabitans]|uniref:Asp23/Gls24 family envelope stress response protein n=1 Tax=unclassified Frondihabitans TaxID=2626248 RepID=UPI000F4DAC55|nr:MULTISPECIES: Asp23/Gls24 family envelope stress response protein [unclassified Frondihabitans]RPE78613.1 putative alkaline shock family protein YloU [Frondihabitans sp. PhB153]RPF08894.1 putative alkaline shock family protein YloU [Frondihabitans sp. PhB161]
MSNTTPTPNAVIPPTASKAVSTSSTTESGTTNINDAVVSKVAGIAAREVRGVHALGGGAGRAIGALRDRVGQTNLAQGISVEVGETQVAVDVTLTAEYPVALQDLADNVRNAVADAVENIVGMEVAEINVTIADVFVPSDDDDDESDSRVK